jgi:hypothetical protein
MNDELIKILDGIRFSIWSPVEVMKMVCQCREG